MYGNLTCRDHSFVIEHKKWKKLARSGVLKSPLLNINEVEILLLLILEYFEVIEKLCNGELHYLFHNNGKS